MYYQRLDVNTSFTFTATATLNNLCAKVDQLGNSAFGMTVLDRVLIDTYDNSFNSSYDAVGMKAFTSEKNTYFGWNRIEAEADADKKINLDTGAATKVTPQAGAKIYLKIVYTGNSITTSYNLDGGEEYAEANTGYAVDNLKKTDSKYVYAGLFIQNAISVTFTDINLIINQ